MSNRAREDHLLAMLWKVRDCFAKINVYGNEDGVSEEQTEIGLRLACELEDEILHAIRSGCDLNMGKCAEEDSEWHKLSDGYYPNDRETVLFYTVGDQVFEGFMSVYDVFHPRIMKGKISFPRHETGWGWYRYRFRDFLSPDCVIAWRHVPKPEGSQSHEKQTV